MDLADAANDLAALLEAAAPRQGLRHPSHARIIAPARKKVERVLRHYWHRQEAALLAEIKPRIVAREAEQEKSSDGKAYALLLLLASMQPLRFPVTNVESDEFNDAIEQAVKGAAASIAADAVIADFASRWLRDNSLSRLTEEIRDTTVKRLRDAVADAWDAGGSFDQVVKAILDTFTDFSEKRAIDIAQTEVNDAYNQGRLYTAVNVGLDEKMWDPDGTDFCEICGGNIDAEWIPIDEPFPSGDMAPTAHPKCDCSVDFRKGEE